MSISAEMVRDLREKTGAGIMDCKNALKDTDGDFEKAIDLLRTKGLAAAAKKGSRVATEGAVHSYIHGNGRIGVLLEVNCETDFVARSPDFLELVRDLAMHIAAANPAGLTAEDVPAEAVAKERAIFKAQAMESGKPEAIAEKMVEGRIAKFYKESALLEQEFVKNPDLSVQQLISQYIAKIGENIKVRRFVRYELGEGLEKKSNDFAAEVAAAAAGA